MKIQVVVRLKPGVLDVQGKAIQNLLDDPSLDHIRVGRIIELDVVAQDFAEAREKVEALCHRVLVNPVMEYFEIKEP